MENEPLLTETVLTALKRHRNGQVFLFNQALSCWDMVPGTWQSAGLRTKATREGRIGEPRRSKEGARLPPKACPDSGLPATWSTWNFAIWSWGSQDFEFLAAESFLAHTILVTMGSNTKILVDKLDNPFNWYRMLWAAEQRIHDKRL